MDLVIKPGEGCRHDLVTLGEVMLRLDPGDRPHPTARTFRAWEGGGEYNVARGLRRCFGLRTAVVTALADNPVGRLIEDLMLQGGVDHGTCGGCRTTASAARSATGSTSPSAASACAARSGCSDRGHTAAVAAAAGGRRLGPIFGARGRALVPHRRHLRRALRDHRRSSPRRPCGRRAGTGRSSPTTSTTGVAVEGDRRAGPRARGEPRAGPLVDVMIGNEEDFSAALGFEVAGRGRAPLAPRGRELPAR